MRVSPRICSELEISPGLKLNPSPSAYDTGSQQGKTTATPKLRITPKFQV